MLYSIYDSIHCILFNISPNMLSICWAIKFKLKSLLNSCEIDLLLFIPVIIQYLNY